MFMCIRLIIVASSLSRA